MQDAGDACCSDDRPEDVSTGGSTSRAAGEETTLGAEVLEWTGPGPVEVVLEWTDPGGPVEVGMSRGWVLGYYGRIRVLAPPPIGANTQDWWACLWGNCSPSVSRVQSSR